jgi:elongation factor Ts
MAEISANLVKDLRDKTGAGMMDCKKALAAANGDLELAIEHLRKTGVAKMSGRSGKATNEGKIVYHLGQGVAVLVEFLCETDFAAKNEKFGAFAQAVADRTAKELTTTGDVSAEVAAREKDRLADLTTNIGEAMQLRRVVRWVPQGKVGVYLHGGGRIGTMADITGTCDDAYLNDVCMHIAAFKPHYLRPEEVPATVIAKEREIAAAQPDLANKPANIIDKILDGKITKWYAEVCLTRQPWIRDDKLSVEKANPKAKIERFVRWQVGEEL